MPCCKMHTCKASVLSYVSACGAANPPYLQKSEEKEYCFKNLIISIEFL